MEAQATTQLASMVMPLVPTTWIEMTADLPAADLCSTSARLRGRVFTIGEDNCPRADRDSACSISQDADVFPQRCGSVSAF